MPCAIPSFAFCLRAERKSFQSSDRSDCRTAQLTFTGSSSPGGFSKFQAEYPALCETNLDGSPNNSSSPTAQVLGLGGLRISSDSSDIESDIDRDPSSATDSDGSPLSNPQPSFPVEILPHLYLGCAKDSTNLDVLEEYGIKYILNVTPNLPNLFENAGEFKYKQIPISDHWSQNLSQFFPEAISFIGELFREKAHSVNSESYLIDLLL